MYQEPFAMSGHLKRDAYVKLPAWAEKDNVEWNLLKPLYGLSAACKDWDDAIRDVLAIERGAECTSLDKSVSFWTQQVFGYGYGKGFRDQNTSTLDNGILTTNEDFETSGERDVIGIIAIHVGDLLISGNGMFAEYITHRMEENWRRRAIRKMKRPIWRWESLK